MAEVADVTVVIAAAAFLVGFGHLFFQARRIIRRSETSWATAEERIASAEAKVESVAARVEERLSGLEDWFLSPASQPYIDRIVSQFPTVPDVRAEARAAMEEFLPRIKEEVAASSEIEFSPEAIEKLTVGMLQTMAAMAQQEEARKLLFAAYGPISDGVMARILQERGAMQKALEKAMVGEGGDPKMMIVKEIASALQGQGLPKGISGIIASAVAPGFASQLEQLKAKGTPAKLGNSGYVL